MLLVNNIYFKRQNKLILKDVNLSIPPKGIIHLTGNNGVGKTTLLKIICKILNPDDGEIFWNGKNDLGKTATSGIYFINLIQDFETLGTKKVIFLR